MRSCNTPLFFESAENNREEKTCNLNSSDSSSEVIPHNDRILLSMSSVGAAEIVVCIFALIMALKFKLHKFFIHRLAIYQVLSASLYSIVCVLEVIFINYDGSSAYHILCIIEGFLLEYTLWIKLMFTFCLTLNYFVLGQNYKFVLGQNYCVLGQNNSVIALAGQIIFLRQIILQILYPRTK